jgi:Domain of unknown function (DUF4384)
MLPKLLAATAGLGAALRRQAAPALLALAGAFGAIAGAAGASEEAVLLASTVPGYAPGMVVAPGERLRLPEGASITLLFRSGQMLRLRGPLESSLDGAEPARRDRSAAALAEAFRLTGVDASVIGGTRAAGLARPRPRAEEIQVDAQRSGTYCIRAQDTVWLVRPTTEAATHALRRRGNLRSVAWPAGATRVEWPSDVPIEDGDRFVVMAEGNAQATLTFRLVADNGLSDAAAIAQGVLLGCREQYSMALRRLARAAMPPELWLSSERGRAPVYRPGEPIGLTVMADADGYLYCVSLRDDGTAVPVFPAGAIDGARLPGATPASIPGHRRSAVLRAGATGTERVRCWLADRDISPELPSALLNGTGTPLPDRLAADLDAVFAGIGGSRMAGASLSIRVE